MKLRTTRTSRNKIHEGQLQEELGDLKSSNLSLLKVSELRRSSKTTTPILEVHRVEIDPNALEDLKYWRKKDKKKLSKIYRLIEVIQATPFKGEGKPEPLKHSLAKCWSRRIDRKHRIVYKVEKQAIVILQCRFHY